MSVNATQSTPAAPAVKKLRIWTWDNLKRDVRKHKYLYLMITPVVVFYVLFHYMPMYGALIAFQRFVPAKGIWGSRWVGLKHFINFFESEYFFRLIRNTFLIGAYGSIERLTSSIRIAQPVPSRAQAMTAGSISGGRRSRIPYCHSATARQPVSFVARICQSQSKETLFKMKRGPVPSLVSMARRRLPDRL